MLAIIPARAGSKGLPKKNTKLFLGRPLIEWSIEQAKEAESVSKILVSTDDEKILKNQYVIENVDYLIRRPTSYSRDTSPATEYLRHALLHPELDTEFDYFCLLQPTSPLRNSKDIDGLYSELVKQRKHAGVTVTEVSHNYLPSQLMDKHDTFVTPSDLNINGSNLRQEKAQSLVARNGAAVYICSTEHFFQSNSIFSSEMAYIVMPKLRSIDIDDMDDFMIAETIAKRIFVK